MTSRPDEHEATARPEQKVPHSQQLEDYAGGYIQARHGRVDAWLLAVYAVLFVWAMYYLYVYWGGLGPGLGF